MKRSIIMFLYAVLNALFTVFNFDSLFLAFLCCWTSGFTMGLGLMIWAKGK